MDLGSVDKVLGSYVYEVSCPSCHHVVSTPFVRIGAVCTCESCRHRYLIDATHFKRVPSPARQTPAGGDAGSAAGQSKTGGIRGLSEMRQREAERERDSRFNDYDTLSPAPNRPAAPAAAPQTPQPPPTPTHTPTTSTPIRPGCSIASFWPLAWNARRRGSAAPA